jgi:Uma2 family endonuclease
MSGAESPLFISVEDYLAAEEKSEMRNEYVEGWVRAMSGASVRHNQVKFNCGYHLMRQLRGKRCRPFDSDMKLRLRRQGRTRFYYPDLQVICESNAPTEQFQDLPVLIIEVLSPSTRQYDLDEKLNAYLHIATLQYYIILEQHMPCAIVLRRTPQGFLRELYEGVEATIELPSLDCTLALREIYEGVEFTATCVQESDTEYEVS